MSHPKTRLLSPQLPKGGTPVLLPQTEAHHALHVLRLEDGDLVLALDGQGHQAVVCLRIQEGKAYIESLADAEGSQKVPPKENQASSSEDCPIILELGILKGPAMEWVIEKAVELGVTECIPVHCARSVVQIRSKGPEFFQQRWQKIADQALKQCGRLRKMRVHLPVSFSTLIQQPLPKEGIRCWCDEQRPATIPFLMDWLVFHTLHFSAGLRILVGPEGGWDPCERELLLSLNMKHHPVSLGDLTLRAETAALFSVSLATAAVRTHLVHSHRTSHETRL